MVQGVTPSATVGIAQVIAVRSAQLDNQGVVMPVRPAQAIYANFRHIQLLPDSRLKDGVPLYKLRILDSLIERMYATGTQGGAGDVPSAAGTNANVPRDEGVVDRLIGDLSRGLRAAGQAASRGSGTSSYRAGFLPLPGAFVDLVA
jgi:hypothetical protein